MQYKSFTVTASAGATSHSQGTVELAIPLSICRRRKVCDVWHDVSQKETTPLVTHIACG